MKKSAKVILVVVIVALVGVIGAMGFLLLRKPEPTVIAEAQNLVLDTSAENIERANGELSQRQVFFTGIGDGMMGREGIILLKNPEANVDIYMKYTVYNEDTGDMLFETDLIEPSKAVNWVPGEVLAPGSYNLSFVQQPYYQAEGSDGWLPLTTGNNHVAIEIVE